MANLCEEPKKTNDAVSAVKMLRERLNAIETHNEDSGVDFVNHPPHYMTESGIEAIDVIKAFTADLSGIEATDTGNIIKYILRWKHKNGLEDLKKAEWYLQHLINEVREKKS